MIARINCQPSPRDLRVFGAVILLAFSLIGWWWESPVVVAGAVIVGGLGLTGTSAARPFYLCWMAIAFLLGTFTSRVILIAVYLGVVTPLGWAGRAIGRDRLGLRDRGRASYWRDLPAPPPKDRYERQF